MTAKARAQLEAARRATAPLNTPEAAIAAGYRPVFGNVPQQGEHYVRVDLVAKDSFAVEQPTVLMFAPVDGKPALVGVAYAYQHPEGAPPPRAFDGADDVWHAHTFLAREPGKTLTMMHAWFVDAPDGPFARLNPWLAYLGAGLQPPAAATLRDSAAADRANQLGFALDLVAAPPLLVRVLQGRSATVSAELDARRDTIRALIPRLKRAQQANDRAAYDRLAAAAIAQQEGIIAALRAANPAPRTQWAINRLVDESMGRGRDDIDDIPGGPPARMNQRPPRP